jgi:AI-2 transport protein TqsA
MVALPNQDKASVSEEPRNVVLPLEQNWAPATRFHRQLVTVAMTVVLLAGLVFLLEKFSTILQQLLTAGFLTYMLLPIHRWLVRRHVPRGPAYLVVLLAILGMGATLALAVQSSFDDFSTNLPAYRKNLERLVERIADDVPGIDKGQVRLLLHIQSSTVDESVTSLRKVIGTLVSVVSQAFVVLIYLIFILAEQTGAHRRIEKAFGSEQTLYVLRVTEQINTSIAEYILIKTLMSLLGGVLTAAAVYFFGVDFPILWGVIAFLLNYIPYLGSLAATVLPVLLALVQFEDVGRALFLLVTLVIVQNGIGYGIEPFLAGSRLNLSPLIIILSLAFWSTLWGVVGMILAVPLVVTVKIILENIPTTQPIAALMSHGGEKQGDGVAVK